MSTAAIEAREILEEIYNKGKSPAAVLINFINGKNKEIAEYKDKYEKLKCTYKHDIDYRKTLEEKAKTEIETLKTNCLSMAQTMPHMAKAERAAARKEFAEIVIADFPEMEFYIKRLIKQIGKAESYAES